MATSVILPTTKSVESFGGGWYGYRMDDGYKVAWKLFEYTADITTASADYGGYRTNGKGVNIPDGLFSDAGSMIVLGELNAFGGARLSGIRADSTTKITFYLTKATSQSDYACKLSILVIGK